jgi:hypothetical protein
MTSAFQVTAFGQENEVSGHTRLSTKPTLPPCDPGVVSWPAKIFFLAFGSPK